MLLSDTSEAGNAFKLRRFFFGMERKELRAPATVMAMHENVPDTHIPALAMSLTAKPMTTATRDTGYCQSPCHSLA